MRRRATVLAVAAILALVAATGVALADNIEGNGGNSRLVGTNGKDTISGGGGNDGIFGRGGADRLFGDPGNDVVRGGKDDDRLQVGLGQDVLLGDSGDDFANAIDGQTNDIVICGPGESDVAGIDAELPSQGEGDEDDFAPDCEAVYVGIGPFPGSIGSASEEARSDSGTSLSAIDTRAEAERAEADGLLRQIR